MNLADEMKTDWSGEIESPGNLLCAHEHAHAH